MNTREQGDLGERAAVVWMLGQGFNVAYPFGQSPDWDLLVEIEDKVHRVQVKTSTCFAKDRWLVQLSTRGGNRSWTGTVKLLDASRCDYLFVLVGDGRQWFIPATELGARSNLSLGGRKYSEFEVDRGPPILPRPSRAPRLESPSLRPWGDARADKGSAL